MILRTSIGLILNFCAGVSFAQLGAAPEKAALKDIEKHQWQKAEFRLRKSMGKETHSPGVRYAFSRFFFHSENPAFDLDSAYHYAVTALDDYALTSPKERDRLFRISLDSTRLVSLRAKIDSAAFEHARRENTEAAYLEFLSHFPSAVQRELAEKLRDEVAYQEAVRANTHQAFLHYLNRYPESGRAGEARDHYDRLLYYDYTRDGRLTSYERFLADYPDTPFRNEIFRHIYEISTGDGRVESFQNFLSRYPKTSPAKRARQMIFYLLADEDSPQWPVHFLNDSLKNLLAINDTYLVPVLQNDLYGFIDEKGEEILPPVYEDIPAHYLCGQITDEVLTLNGHLVSRSGTTIYSGEAREVTDLGMGFLKILTSGGIRVVHKGGFVLKDSLADMRILGRRYLALKRDNGWFLHTLTGRLLDERPWDEISTLHGVVLFEKDEKFFITPLDQPGRSAEGHPLRLSEPLDEVRPWSQGLVWGRAGDYQGVFDPSLQAFIGFDRHTLTETPFGATAALPNGVALYNRAGRRSSTFDQLKILGKSVGIKTGGAWFVFDPVSQEIQEQRYDSLTAEGPFIIGWSTDAVHIYFNDVATVFNRPLNASFIPGMDSSSFLLVHQNGAEKKVFDLKGSMLFTGYFDAIEYAGQEIFVITRRGKKGLINASGKNLLSAEFDAIGSARGNVLSLLKNKRFGAYNIRENKLIRPQYDRNLIPYSEHLLVTFKNGSYGFLGWDNKAASVFAFDEIMHWQDSVALVKKGDLWSFYDIFSWSETSSKLRKITMVRNVPGDKVAIIQRDNLYGVINQHGEMVIPLTFSDIINLGSEDEPLYFTEKHIREASLFIVIYYDGNGAMLRKEIYEDAAGYDKIYCSDN